MPVFSYSRRLTVRSPSSACIGDERFSLPHVLTLCRDADKEISRQRGWVVNLSLQHCPEMLLLFLGLHFLSSLQIFGCISTFLCSLFLGFFPHFWKPCGFRKCFKDMQLSHAFPFYHLGRKAYIYKHWKTNAAQAWPLVGYPEPAGAGAGARGAGAAWGATENPRGRSLPRWYQEQLSCGDGKTHRSAKLEGAKLSLRVFPKLTQARSRAPAVHAAPLGASPVQRLISSWR